MQKNYTLPINVKYLKHCANIYCHRDLSEWSWLIECTTEYRRHVFLKKIRHTSFGNKSPAPNLNACHLYILSGNKFQNISDTFRMQSHITRPCSLPISYFNVKDDGGIFYFHTKYYFPENTPSPEDLACITSDRESFSLSQHEQPKSESFLNLGGQFFSQKQIEL